ncbi:PcfJ domain-containing protein [Gemmiger formicilis]|uniref:PcfJ domain-containing protein n=1 Tax=Gemmiger formicilis TaxID=745368 RepID=UPI003CF0C1DD
MKGNQESMLYTTNAAVASLNHVPGFDPLKFLRHTASRKTGEDVMRLDLRYKKLWFRLACPTGRLKLNALRITEKMAIFEAKVYRDREDAEPLSSYVANCTLDATPGGLYVEAAQEEALDMALSNAGFGIQFADVGSESKEYGSEVPVGVKAEIAKPVQVKTEVAKSVQTKTEDAEPVKKQPEAVKVAPQEPVKADPLDAIIAKAQGKRAAYHEDRETCQVIRQISPQELVVRIYKLYWSYAKGKDSIRKSAYEVMRIFVRTDDGKKAIVEPYYYDSGYDSVSRWRRGYHPGALFGMECFISEETGKIYLPGLEKALKGTAWEYCALRQFYERTAIPMQVSHYLKMYLQHPLLIERLTKVGFENIVADVVCRHGFSDALDEEQTKTHRILRVEKQDVSVLREQKTGVSLLKKYQAYVAIHLRGRAELFQWQLHHKVSEIPADIFQYLTAEKFMHYMEAQFPIYWEKRPANVYRDPTMETLVITYVDYLHMCRRQAYDMKDKSVLFPKNCAAAHDREAERIQKINDAQKNRAFGRAYAGFARKAVLSNEELQIVCPKRTNDLVAEGRALHHCVGSYIDRVAEGSCLIVFVRRVEEPKKPYVTVEVRDGKIAQIHGDHNSDPTEEVKKFVDLWSRKVLPMALQAA